MADYKLSKEEIIAELTRMKNHTICNGNFIEQVIDYIEEGEDDAGFCEHVLNNIEKECTMLPLTAGYVINKHKLTLDELEALGVRFKN